MNNTLIACGQTFWTFEIDTTALYDVRSPMHHQQESSASQGWLGDDSMTWRFPTVLHKSGDGVTEQ